MSEENDNRWLESLRLGSKMIIPDEIRNKTSNPILVSIWLSIGIIGVVNAVTTKKAIREWQHELFRKYGKSTCYVLFLVLPSDLEAITYLTHYGQELHQISGDNALVLAFSEANYKIATSKFQDWYWNASIIEQIDEGLSLKVARLFDIKYSEFPCLLIFEDIRSPQHIMINLKNLTAGEISLKMREVFSSIQKAATKKEAPISTIKKDLAIENIQKTGQVTINTIQGFAGKTFEAALKAWAEVIVK